MQSLLLAIDLSGALPLLSTLCQMTTAVIAVTIGVVTYRYTRQQSALTLINHNNVMANTVNSTIIASPEARAALGRFQDAIIGSPDDAVLFMYLNYVHNTFRMRQIGAVSAPVWQDTLASCVALTRKLSRDQLQRFLARGYEPAFRTAILVGFDATAPSSNDNVLPMKQSAEGRARNLRA